MPVGARIVAKESYYRTVKPDVSKTYSADEAISLRFKNRQDGPWNDDEQLGE